MSRAERLLALLESLRQRRHPVPGATLAQQLGISVRTLYRDIASLQAQGAHIEGEPGVGYVLRPGFTLPPLMLGTDEVEALALGARWVARRSADPALAEAAQRLLAKVHAVLPPAARFELEHSPFLMPPVASTPLPPDLLPTLRRAIRGQSTLRLRYADAEGAPSDRVVWPFALGFFESSRLLSAWCELRQDYRHFRLDRIQRCDVLDTRYPRARQALMREWRAQQGVTEDS